MHWAASQSSPLAWSSAVPLHGHSPEHRSGGESEPLKIQLDMKRDLEDERVYRSLSMSSEMMLLQPSECLICLDEFTAEKPCVSTVCGGCGVSTNRYHEQCLLDYRRERGSLATCVICEQAIYTDEM